MKLKENVEETVEVVEEVTETKTEEVVDEPAEVKVEEAVEEPTEAKVEEVIEEVVDEPVRIRRELKTKHYQHPDDLVKFVNENKIKIVAIVAFDRFQALYYFEK